MAQAVTTRRRDKSVLYEDVETDPEDCEDCQAMGDLCCFRHFER
jgi:hypothetical protein